MSSSNISDSYNTAKKNEQYFRPSPFPALNIRDYNYDFFDRYSNKDYKKVVLPNSLFSSPKETIINYFSILREAENISSGGCGTIGNSRSPYPVSYNFLSADYQNKITYENYLKLFKDIGHINLIKLNDVTSTNNPQQDFKYFFEIETIEPSVNGNTGFTYYYGFIYVKKYGEKYEITEIDLRGEDFLCAAYHGWSHNAELYVDATYGEWCHLLKKRYPAKQNGYIKDINIIGTDGHEYKFEFFQLTNGTDIEIYQFIKTKNNKWKPIKIDVNKCINNNDKK